MRHVARNPRVALNFSTDEEGGKVGVLTGEARLLKGKLDAVRLEAYIEKYAEGIEELRMTPESMLAEYNAVLLDTLTSLRGS